MPIWLLEPAAAPEDGRWQGREIHRLVIVAAPTAALARLTAEHWAGAFPEMSNENVSAGFSDEKLYSVREAPDALATDTDESRVILAVGSSWTADEIFVG